MNLKKQIKDATKKKELLNDYIYYAFQKLEEFIKINDPKEVEYYQNVILKTLEEIGTLVDVIHELKRDAKMVR